MTTRGTIQKVQKLGQWVLELSLVTYF